MKALNNKLSFFISHFQSVGLQQIIWPGVWLLLLLASLPFLATPSLAGCGVRFLPAGASPFENIRDNGTYQYQLNLGKLIVGDEKLPLYAFFETTPTEYASGLFGPGWRIGLFDHRAFINDTHQLVWIGPSGDETTFFRSREERSGRHQNWGSRAWNARSEGQRIEVSSSCGWRFHYSNGRPVALRTPSGDQLSFHYDSSGRLQRLSAGGYDYLRFTYSANPTQPHVMENRFLDERWLFLLKQESHPIYHEQRFVRDFRVDRISEIQSQSANRSRIAIDYGHDRSTRTSTLTIDSTSNILGQNTFARWETESGRVLETQRYRVTENKGSDSGDRIRLVVLENGNQENIWDRDLRAGRNFLKLSGSPGVETIKILGGPASGQTRSERLTFDDGTERFRQFSYDSQGRKVRLLENGQLLRSYMRDERKRTTELKNGKGNLLWRRYHDDGGRVTRIYYADGSQLEFQWSGIPRAILTQGERKVTMNISDLPETLRNQINQ